MTCLCEGKGVIKIGYHDGSPADYAVCRCPVGMDLRSDRNAGKGTGSPLWLVWAAREQVNPEQVCLVEDVLDADELARIPQSGTAAFSSIAAAMQTRRPKL